MGIQQKITGSYYTPLEAARSLVGWAIREPEDRLLDPSCGDGRFLAMHRRSVGVEQDPEAGAEAMRRAPWALVHEGDFFSWAEETTERFECAAGNPPFIRYQRFSGEIRARALSYCRSAGAVFSSLTSSWAPFLVATANLLKPGGRMAFVVPAEIGHAPYAGPLLRYLLGHFREVQIVAILEKIFPHLSEDCWLLFADGYGDTTDHLKLTALDRLRFPADRPRTGTIITRKELSARGGRPRNFLVPEAVRALYRSASESLGSYRFGEVAKIGIGYVTGANDFFHLKPSEAHAAGIPGAYLHATVRNGRVLTKPQITDADVSEWLRRDEAALLLRIRRDQPLVPAVRKYLSTTAAEEASSAYKCRSRTPWYVVPDVTVPDAFLSYMSGIGPSLVSNLAGCSCTNSVHAVRLNGQMTTATLFRRWNQPLTKLSCEIEGHPLGGGMLKIEPGEACRILLAEPDASDSESLDLIHSGIEALRRWRHYG